jgi:hypothetical protein
MARVDLEANAITYKVDECGKLINGDGTDVATPAAHQMNMWVVIDRVVSRWTASQMGVGDQANVVQRLQRAVRGGKVDWLAFGSTDGNDLVDGDVTHPRN